MRLKRGRGELGKVEDKRESWSTTEREARLLGVRLMAVGQ